MNGGASSIQIDACGFGYSNEHAFGIAENVIVPQSEQRPSLCFQERLTSPVDQGPVLTAVNLDDQTQGHACEIRHVWADRDLTAKLDTCKPPIAEQPPKPTLGIRRVLAQPPCSVPLRTLSHTGKIAEHTAQPQLGVRP